MNNIEDKTTEKEELLDHAASEENIEKNIIELENKANFSPEQIMQLLDHATSEENIEKNIIKLENKAKIQVNAETKSNFRQNNNYNNNKQSDVELPIFTDDSSDSLKIIFLGGAEEIGKSSALYIYKDNAILVDCGSSFASISGGSWHSWPSKFNFLSLPDFKIIEKYAPILKGIFITHSHEDHIGGLPFLLQELEAKNYMIPIYCGSFPAEYLKLSLEKKQIDTSKIRIQKLNNNSFIKIAEDFGVKAIKISHSAPDSYMFVIKSKEQKVLHTGDWKIDVYQEPKGTIHWPTLTKEVANSTLMICDSTRGGNPGYSTSEHLVINSFKKLFTQNPNRRILVTTFGSNANRITEIIKLSKQFNRKVFVAGYGIVKSLSAATKAGILKKNSDYSLCDRLKNEQTINQQSLVFLSGSQGEGTLKKVCQNKHIIKLNKEDIVVYSSDIIPGNEKQSFECLKLLLQKNALIIHRVLDSSYHNFHSSGHGSSDEIGLLIDLAKPKFFVPVHGNYVQCFVSSKNAINNGITEENIIIPKNGDVLVLNTDNTVTKFQYKNFEPLYLDEFGQKLNIKDFDLRFDAFSKGILIFTTNKNEILNINYFFVNDLFKALPMPKINTMLTELSESEAKLPMQEKITRVMIKLFEKPKIALLPVIYNITSPNK